MSKSKPLVDIAELKRLMSGIKLKDPLMNEFINARWLNYVEWWDTRSRKAKQKYQWMRGAVVVGSALIPALVGLRELKQFESAAWAFAVASIVVSLVVAVCGGLESLFGFGDIWREKRLAAELIKSEGFSFLQLTGDYKDFNSHDEAVKQFSANVETLIKSEIKEYIVAVKSKNDGKS